jgi:hypothetical protein
MGPYHLRSTLPQLLRLIHSIVTYSSITFITYSYNTRWGSHDVSVTWSSSDTLHSTLTGMVVVVWYGMVWWYHHTNCSAQYQVVWYYYSME